MGFRGLSWAYMGLFMTRPWAFMAISWDLIDSMCFHGLSWDSMGFHGLSWGTFMLLL